MQAKSVIPGAALKMMGVSERKIRHQKTISKCGRHFMIRFYIALQNMSVDKGRHWSCKITYDMYMTYIYNTMTYVITYDIWYYVIASAVDLT